MAVTLKGTLFLTALLFFSHGSEAQQAPDGSKDTIDVRVSLILKNRIVGRNTLLGTVACAQEQARNCQRVSDTCGSTCENLLAKALTDCMNVCACDYYHCKIACGDDASMPPACQQ
jgi:hypothetical protein